MTGSYVVAVLCTLAALLPAQSPRQVDAVSFAEARTIAQLDMGKLKGEPSKLAWSADGSQFYVQTLEGGFGRPDAKLRHYIFNAATGEKQDAKSEPEWAAEYWAAKSAQASPDDRTFKIEAKTEQRTQRTTSAPMGGDLARGGAVTGETGSSTGEGVAAAYSGAGVTVNLMVLKGETIGEFVNSVLVPGLTFGWGPKGTRLIAFAAPKTGRVTVMDSQGGRKEVAGSKDAILPAWSPDGRQLAWLQKDGRKKFALHVANVTTTSS